MRLKDSTILLVDDEIGLLRIFKRWFEREGSLVLTAENGVEALHIVKENAIDMIVSDVRMPQMDGIELAKRVKAMGKYFPKIIFISGFADIDERECCDVGIEFKLSKPIRRESLMATVNECLTEREKLWREPPEAIPEKTLNAVFENVLDAQAQGLIAFGNGGICVHSALSVRTGETIGLNMGFTADRRALKGQGVVRWTAPDEQQIGIEVTYIDDANRAWLANLPGKNETVSFIPRSSDTAGVRNISRHTGIHEKIGVSR
jgi:CheY-like chemotaxis protein